MYVQKSKFYTLHYSVNSFISSLAIIKENMISYPSHEVQKFKHFSTNTNKLLDPFPVTNGMVGKK